MESSEAGRTVAATEGEVTGKTGVTARREESAPRPIPPLAAALVAAAATLGAAVLIRTGTPAGVSGGVLLAVVALVAGAVLLGGEEYGPEREGGLSLSERLGLGLLGGTLGALAAAGAEWLVGTTGFAAALGVEITGRFAAADLGLHLLGGALWGLVFGAALGAVPGRGVLLRGSVFALIPALWMMLKVLPFDRQAGFFGVELGTLTVLFVLLFWFLWGVTTAWVIAWGERTEMAPLDRPLGA